MLRLHHAEERSWEYVKPSEGRLVSQLNCRIWQDMCAFSPPSTLVKQIFTLTESNCTHYTALVRKWARGIEYAHNYMQPRFSSTFALAYSKCEFGPHFVVLFMPSANARFSTFSNAYCVVKNMNRNQRWTTLGKKGSTWSTLWKKSLRSCKSQKR